MNASPHPFELSPCLDSLFPAQSDVSALRALAELGFRRFEFWDWRTHDLAVLADAGSVFGLQPVVFSGNTFTEPLLAVETRPDALAHLRRSLDAAALLGVRTLVAHVGYVGDRAREEQWRTAVDTLRTAGAMAAAAGVVLLLEPLNSSVDHPGYFLDSLPAARRLIDEVDLPSVRLLLDVYHMWLMHADLLALLPEILPLVGHVHIADAPGRRQPGTGTIPWPRVMAELTAGGYGGVIGLEYFPSTDVSSSLLASRRVLCSLD